MIDPIRREAVISAAKSQLRPDVDVILAVREEAEHVVHAVTSIRAQRYDGRVHIYVAVAPSEDGTSELLRTGAVAGADLTVIDNPIGRTPTGLNLAFDAGSAQVVVRVDGHSELDANFISMAVESLLKTGAANVGGRQVARGRSPFERAVAEAMTSTFGTGASRFHVGGESGPTDTVYLGVFDRSWVERVGRFDQRLIRNQDYELNIRLRRAGGLVWYDDRLGVGYRPRSSVRALARQYFEYGVWKSVVARMYPQAVRPRQMIPALATLVLLVSCVLSVRSRRWGIVPAVYAAAVVVASSRSRSRRWLLAIYPIMHISWGGGFLFGLVSKRTLTMSVDERDRVIRDAV